MTGRVLEHAARFPHAPAYISRFGSLTYGELAGQAQRLAGYLLRRDPGPDPVAIWGHKEPAMPVCMLACILAGKPYIPIDASTPQTRLEQILQSASPGTLLAVRPVPLDDRRVVSGGDLANALTESPLGPLPQIPSSELAYIIYTSGSSGVPKGVKISRGNLKTFLSWAEALPPLGERGGVVLNQARFSFDLSVADLHWGLYTGQTVYVLEDEVQRDFRLLFSCLKDSGATVAVMTPSFAALCLRDRSFCRALMPKLGTVFFCGEPLPPGTVRRMFERFPGLRVVNAYGPTETTVAVTAAETGEGDLTAALPVGRPGGGNCVYVVSPDMTSLPEGQEGEIVIAGPSVGRGYTDGNPRGYLELSGEPAYRTGDRGVLRGGQLYCLGRMDRQVKLGGYRIELGDIENNFEALEEVEACVVLPNSSQRTLPGTLTAFVQLKKGVGVEEGALRSLLAKRLPAYMVPRNVRVVDALPLTPNGKRNIQALERMMEGEDGGPG